MIVLLILAVLLGLGSVAAGVAFGLRRPKPEPSVIIEEVLEPPPEEPAPEQLTNNVQGNPMSLNDLMFTKLKARYPSLNGSLNDYLRQFQKDNGG